MAAGRGRCRLCRGDRGRCRPGAGAGQGAGGSGAGWRPCCSRPCGAQLPDPASPDAAARAALYAALAEMPSELDPADPAKVAEGGRLYATYCAACHGPDLGGAPDWDWRTPRPSGRMAAPPHDATGHTWHHPDQHLFALTALGPGPFAPPGYQSDMPGFRDRLSDDQIWAILSFIKSRWPVPVREAHDRLSAGMAR
ncbi:c-type cytochrome [Tistrella bauzanensis]